MCIRDRGGMGLIRKAAEQGKQAIDTILTKKNAGNALDVLIIGAGPAGLSASLAAKDQKLKYLTIEQEASLGGAIYKYPRNKVAMTQPVTLPIVGKVEMYDISKEELLGFWLRVLNEQKLKDVYKRQTCGNAGVIHFSTFETCGRTVASFASSCSLNVTV